MQKKYVLPTGYLVGIISLCFVACGGNDSSVSSSEKKNDSTSIAKFITFKDAEQISPSWSKENTVVYLTISQPENLHPTNGLTGDTEAMLYTQVYLFTVDFQKLAVCPYAVEQLPIISPDGLRYTYKLRNDITFDDGQPLTVEDVIFTYKANKCPLTNNPNTKPFLDNIKDIVADKDKPGEFTVIMKEKYIHNLDMMEDYPLLQRSVFDKNNVLAKYSFTQLDDKNFKADQHKDLNDWATELNSAKYGHDINYLAGAGPYKIEKWEPGQSITLVRKKNHWSQKTSNPVVYSYPERIIFKLNKDENSQMLEFKAQTIDATSYLTTKTLLELQKDPSFNANYNSAFTSTYNFWYAAMNCKPDGVKNKKLFTDKRVRRAMAMLTPVNQINKVLNNGRNSRVVGPVSPFKPEYNTDLKLIELDIEGAKKLLDEAGWKDTDGDNIRDKVVDGVKIQFEFNLNYMTSTVDWKNTALMMAEQMYKAGVKAIPTPLDYVVQYAKARAHNYDMMLAVNAGTFASEDYTQNWHSSSWLNKGSNFSGFGSAQSDALIDSIKYTLDDAQRNKMAKELQVMLYDEQPYIFLFASQRRLVIHKRFGNQEMYFERPGLMLGSLKLLSGSSQEQQKK
jgi:peptide/nickel transport system substrate-binding protein